MCRFYRFLYSILPFKKIKSTLIKKHLSVCEACRTNTWLEKLPSDVEAIKTWADNENSLWPEISSNLQTQERIKTEPKKGLASPPLRIWRWAATFFAAAILVVVSFLLQKGQKMDVPSEEVQLVESLPKVILKRVELNGKKARPIIYQTSTVSIIFLVEDKKTGGIND